MIDEISKYKIFCRRPDCRNYRPRQEGWLYYGICALENIWIDTKGECMDFREPREVILKGRLNNV